MFGDTLRALAEANETGEDAFDVLDREIGWPRLVQARADVEALATTAEADPLLGAAERYSWVRRYAPALLEAFTFRSTRARDPLLTAIELLRQLNREDRRALPTKVPVGHLKEKVRKLIAADGKRDRRLWEIATLAVLRDRLRAGDRRQAHGRRLGWDQRATDHLGPAVSHPARDLQIGPGRDHQCPSGASSRRALGQRHDLLLGRPVLPSCQPGRQAQRHQRSLQR
jgi:hypothetical protein